MFKRKKKSPELNVIGFHPDGISYVSVNRSDQEKPRITALEFISCEDEQRSATLDLLVKKYHLKKTECASFLRFEDYRLLSTETPEVPEEDTVDALRWEIKDMIDFPVEEATIDVYPVPEEAANQNIINVIAAKKAVVIDRAAMFKEAKLKLNMIDIEELAYRNIAATQEKESQGSVVVVIRKDHGMVLFCKAGELHFSRRLGVGYDTLNSDSSKIESVALEIQRSIDYFDRHFANVGMNNLILLPYPGNEENIIKFLDSNLSVTCSISDLNQGIEWAENINHEQKVRCLLALGTALRVEEGKAP